MNAQRVDGPVAELIIRGRVATLVGPRGFGWVEALAVTQGRVVAAGSLAEVTHLGDGRSRHWRLGPGFVVTPSITDAHLHLALAALAAAQPDLAGLDLAAVGEAIARAHQRSPDRNDRDAWLLGHGWSFEALGGRPSAALLDAAADGRPVALWAHDHHSRWVSRRAIELAGLTDRADPPAGRIERDPSGAPTGILYERAAGLVEDVIPRPADEDVAHAVTAYARDLARLGVTSVHDPGGLAPDPGLRRGPTLYSSLAAAGRLPLRVTACIREEQLEHAIDAGFRTGRTTLAADLEDGMGRYRDGWLKLFSDGALGSRTAALLEPYEPDDRAGPPPGGPRGLPLHDAAELLALAGRAADAGIASQIHAIGDAAVRAVLGVLGRVPVVAGALHRVEHAQLVHRDDVPRFAALGVAASVQPCHLLSDAGSVRAAWGSRSASAFPLADLDRAGTLLPFGTDAPVESPDPWRGLAAAVTRRDVGWPDDGALHPEQALGLWRAIRAACLDGPRSARVPDEGHLGPGARADLLVVPSAAFEAPQPSAELLQASRPLVTALDGEVVWCAPGFDPEVGGPS